MLIDAVLIVVVVVVVTVAHGPPLACGSRGRGPGRLVSLGSPLPLLLGLAAVAAVGSVLSS
jgi:hypothetical protein